MRARPTLIYNPPGTTHRDRFHVVDGRMVGRFFSVAVAAARLARIEAQVPLVDGAVCLADPQAAAPTRARATC